MNHAWLALLGGALQRLSDEYLEMQFAMQARKQRLELLPLHFASSSKTDSKGWSLRSEEAKAGAFAYVSRAAKRPGVT
jgi:hypothetical protein